MIAMYPHATRAPKCSVSFARLLRKTTAITMSRAKKPRAAHARNALTAVHRGPAYASPATVRLVNFHSPPTFASVSL